MIDYPEEKPRLRIIERKSCEEVKLKPMQKAISIFALLGLSVILCLVFMISFFFGERLEITPFLGIIFINNLTQGENWILFFCFFIFSVFIGIFIIWVVYRHYREKIVSMPKNPLKR